MGLQKGCKAAYKRSKSQVGLVRLTDKLRDENGRCLCHSGRCESALFGAMLYAKSGSVCLWDHYKD